MLYTVSAPPYTTNMAATDIARNNEAPIDSRSDSTFVTVEETREFSIDDAVESLGFGAFHLLIMLFCGLGLVCDLSRINIPV